MGVLANNVTLFRRDDVGLTVSRRVVDDIIDGRPVAETATPVFVGDYSVRRLQGSEVLREAAHLQGREVIRVWTKVPLLAAGEDGRSYPDRFTFEGKTFEVDTVLPTPEGGFYGALASRLTL